MNEPTDEIVALVLQARAGDRKAFSRLLGTHERLALATAFAVVGCAATAADVVQDAMLRAWQRLGDLDAPARFSSWLCRIVRNLAVDTLRRSPRARADSDVLESIHFADCDAAAEAETREQLNHALLQLDELSRLAVTLRYYDNLSSGQIGELIGLSPAAVDMRLSRARGLLREQLSCLLYDSPDRNSAPLRHGGVM